MRQRFPARPFSHNLSIKSVRDDKDDVGCVGFTKFWKFDPAIHVRRGGKSRSAKRMSVGLEMDRLFA